MSFERLILEIGFTEDDKNEILLQRRSSKKKQGANKISITAGHVEVGETTECAAVRELSEEVGIFAKISDLIFLGIYRNEQMGNRCFSYTYLVKSNKKIEEMMCKLVTMLVFRVFFGYNTRQSGRSNFV